MSKLDLITVAIVIVCLAALGYLVYKIVNLMNPPQEETTAIVDSYTEPTTEDSTYTDWDDEVENAVDNDDLDDADVATNDTDDSADNTNDSGSYSDNEMDNDSDDVAEESTLKSKEDDNSTTRAYDSPASSSSVGKYLVIAGSYRQKINAENQVNKLRRLGYSDSSVSSFNHGALAVALVDRFSSYNEAKALVRKLAGNGIEAMIKEKN